MALYEHIFLARQDISAQQVDALVEQYKGVIESFGGKVGRVENWGLKSLTYRIKRTARLTTLSWTSTLRRLQFMKSSARCASTKTFFAT